MLKTLLDKHFWFGMFALVIAMFGGRLFMLWNVNIALQIIAVIIAFIGGVLSQWNAFSDKEIRPPISLRRDAILEIAIVTMISILYWFVEENPKEFYTFIVWVWGMTLGRVLTRIYFQYSKPHIQR